MKMESPSAATIRERSPRFCLVEGDKLKVDETLIELE